MKALTIWQPYAALVVNGIKDVENRGWKPPPSLMGERLAIHAGMKTDTEVHLSATMMASTHLHVHGAIIGTVRLAGVVNDSGSRWATPGAWQWLLTDPKKFRQPVPAQGKQGLWTVTTPLPGVRCQPSASARGRAPRKKR
jgi:hypothetical protein